MEADAHAFQCGPKQATCGSIQLHCHRVRHQFDDMNLKTAIQQPARRFESQQATTENYSFARARGMLHDLKRIIKRTKNKDAVEESAFGGGESFDGRNNWPRPSRKDQAVIMLLESAGCKNQVSAAIDRVNTNSRVERDAVLRIPLVRIQKDVIGFVRSGKNTRQEYSVVVSIRLISEHNNIEGFLAVAHDKFFDKARACHPITDHDQALLY